jgi:hypothetical protein
MQGAGMARYQQIYETPLFVGSSAIGDRMPRLLLLLGMPVLRQACRSVGTVACRCGLGVCSIGLVAGGKVANLRRNIQTPGFGGFVSQNTFTMKW